MNGVALKGNERIFVGDFRVLVDAYCSVDKFYAYHEYVVFIVDYKWFNKSFFN